MSLRMKEFFESIKTPLWLVASVIAAWGSWTLTQRRGPADRKKHKVLCSQLLLFFYLGVTAEALTELDFVCFASDSSFTV